MKCNGISQVNKLYLGWVPDLLISNGMSVEEVDITMFFSYASVSFNELQFTDNLYHKTKEVQVVRFNLIFKYYKAIIDKTCNEGLYELASALLSLYLFARAISCKCKFGDIVEVLRLIEKVIHLPASKTLRLTLNIITGMAEKYCKHDNAAMLAKKVFQQYTLQLLKIPHLSSSGEVKPKKTDAKVWLNEQIGETRLAKLSESSIDWLVQYRSNWLFHSADYCFEARDYFDLVMCHCKMLELELGHHYRTFFTSKEFSSYCAAFDRPNRYVKDYKPTLGDIIHDLSHYKNYPPELKAILKESSMMIHEDEGLVKEIRSIASTYRNPASHSNVITPLMYTKFLTKMYNNKVLCRFIDTINHKI